MRSIADVKKNSILNDKELLMVQLKESVASGEYGSLIEALNEFCEEHDIDYDKITKFIHPNLKDLIYNEAISRGMMSLKEMRNSKLENIFDEEEIEEDDDNY